MGVVPHSESAQNAQYSLAIRDEIAATRLFCSLPHAGVSVAWRELFVWAGCHLGQFCQEISSL